MLKMLLKILLASKYNKSFNVRSIYQFKFGKIGANIVTNVVGIIYEYINSIPLLVAKNVSNADWICGSYWYN